jgi:hypothetical protein
MTDVLRRISVPCWLGIMRSAKKRAWVEADSLTELDVAESILNGVAIYKVIRSRSPMRRHTREYLYVIQSTSLDGLIIYTKGKLVQEAGVETFTS